MRPFRLLSVIVATCLSAAAARAALPQTQSLAEIAKKEEERRKSAQPAKVYTNKDLTPAPPGSPPPAANGAPKDAKDGGAKDAKNPADAKDAKGGDGKDTGTKDQKYWSDKIKALREQLDRDKTFADALQTKVNSLTTDFVNRDDPAQKRIIEADRQKAIAELARLNKAIVDDQKAIADFEEEARRAAVPAGWLR
jgi:hypothetical protein